jgi:hypothetical protein
MQHRITDGKLKKYSIHTITSDDEKLRFHYQENGSGVGIAIVWGYGLEESQIFVKIEDMRKIAFELYETIREKHPTK